MQKEVERENLTRMTCYAYRYRLGRADAYLLWYTSEVGEETGADGVVLDDAGRLLSFCSLADLRGCAAHHNLRLAPEVNAEPLDLDAVQSWLGAARKRTVNCPVFLDAWNLFSDLASAVQGVQAHIDDQAEGGLYDKLFWGSRLPALTPPGPHRAPLWTKSEVGRLQNVLNRGLRLFQDRLAAPVAKEGLR